MPDLRCPRCGSPSGSLAMIGLHEEHGVLPGGIGSRADRLIYRCSCGPLAVVEGESVTWYAPMDEVKRLESIVDDVRVIAAEHLSCKTDGTLRCTCPDDVLEVLGETPGAASDERGAIFDAMDHADDDD